MMKSDSYGWRWVTIALLLLAVLPLPYPYYLFLRLWVCGVCIYYTYHFFNFFKEQKQEPPKWLWLLGAMVIVFNPFIPVHLTRELWIPFDLGGAFIVWKSIQWQKRLNQKEAPEHLLSAKKKTATVMSNTSMKHPTDLADRGTRLVASIIDSLLVLAVPFALIMFLALVYQGNTPSSAESDMLIGFIFWAGIVGVGIFQLYFLSIQGQTLGKKWLKIRIVDFESRQTGGFVQNVLSRVVLNQILNFVPLYGLIDTLSIFRADQRCLHDQIAGTVVVKEGEGQVPSTRRITWIIPVAISLGVACVLLGIYAMANINQSNTAPYRASDMQKADASTYTFYDTEGLVSVIASSDWSEVSGVNDDASLQLMHTDDLYAILITEPKEDFNLDVDEYADLVLENFREKTDLAQLMSGPLPTTIGGKAAIQYEFSAASEGVNMIMLFTFVEGSGHYHQLITWSTKSNYSTNRPVFNALLQGFRIQ